MDRQRMLIIFGVAWVSAALLTWFLYARTKAPKEEKTTSIIAAVRDLPVGEKIGEKDVHVVTVLERNAPRTALTSPAQAIGRAVVYPIGANEAVTAARLTSLSGAEGAAAILPEGTRAVSVSFNDTSGASGLILPKSRVDVLYTRTGNVYETLTVTLLEDVEVLSIGRVTEIPRQDDTKKKTTTVSTSSNTNRTATLILAPDQVQKLELARNNGRISLSLRNPLDRSTIDRSIADNKAAVIEHIEPMILTRSSTNFRKRALPGAVGDGEWNALIGEGGRKKKAEEPKPEPPKPRAVVDVFRGEKHVQEIFQ